MFDPSFDFIIVVVVVAHGYDKLADDWETGVQSPVRANLRPQNLS